MRGHLDRFPLEEDFVQEVARVLRGGEPSDIGRPALEEKIKGIETGLRDSSLREDGYFVRKARWPGGSRLAVCLTHDVDNISRPSSHLWRTRSRFGFFDVFGGLLGLVRPYDNVRLIVSNEKERGFRSSFYFLTTNYPLAQVVNDSNRARSQGRDIGLHGDFGTHDSVEKMNEAVARFLQGLGFRPSGLREHYLKFDFEKSWAVMEQAGFDYDTTVGTNDRLGFRLGLASPFHPPDGSWAPLNLIELPLSLMDTTLWGYLKRTEEQGMADFLGLLEKVEKVEGLFTLLWHQEAVRMKGGRIYWRVLDELKSRGCFVGTGAEVASWWRARAVPLVRDGKLIRLGGEPPNGLTLRLETTEGTAVRVSSATYQGESGLRMVTPLGRDFQLEVV